MIKADACSVLADREPLAGSAPFGRAWLVVEHPGPWGRQALTDSGLPEAVVQHICEAEAQSPIRFLAARRIDHDRRHGESSLSRRVWLAHCDPRSGETRTVTIDDLQQIVEWDLIALTAGRFPDVGERLHEPVEFICTHSKRDSCCAVLGRERAAHVPPTLYDRVWECSHLGGHRFAATSVFLPSGRVYGRLPRSDSAHTSELTEPDPRHLRGSSYLPPALQAAEAAVRIQAHLTASDALNLEELDSTANGVTALVTGHENQEWHVVCEAHTFTSPASCGASTQDRTIWRAKVVEERHAGGHRIQ
jgi:hypothetical protein